MLFQSLVDDAPNFIQLLLLWMFRELFDTFFVHVCSFAPMLCFCSYQTIDCLRCATNFSIVIFLLLRICSSIGAINYIFVSVSNPFLLFPLSQTANDQSEQKITKWKIEQKLKSYKNENENGLANSTVTNELTFNGSVLSTNIVLEPYHVRYLHDRTGFRSMWYGNGEAVQIEYGMCRVGQINNSWNS